MWVLTNDEDGCFTVRFPLQTISPVEEHHNSLRHQKVIRNAPDGDGEYVVLQDNMTWMLVSVSDLTVFTPQASPTRTVGLLYF